VCLRPWKFPQSEKENHSIIRQLNVVFSFAKIHSVLIGLLLIYLLRPLQQLFQLSRFSHRQKIGTIIISTTIEGRNFGWFSFPRQHALNCPHPMPWLNRQFLFRPNYPWHVDKTDMMLFSTSLPPVSILTDQSIATFSAMFSSMPGYWLHPEGGRVRGRPQS